MNYWEKEKRNRLRCKLDFAKKKKNERKDLKKIIEKNILLKFLLLFEEILNTLNVKYI